jgi:hypothetical protein
MPPVLDKILKYASGNEGGGDNEHMEHHENLTTRLLKRAADEHNESKRRLVFTSKDPFNYGPTIAAGSGGAGLGLILSLVKKDPSVARSLLYAAAGGTLGAGLGAAFTPVTYRGLLETESGVKARQKVDQVRRELGIY